MKKPTSKAALDDDVLLLDRRNANRTLDFLGVCFAPLNPDQLLERIVEKASSKSGYGYLATPNTDHLVRLDNDETLRPLYEEAWTNVCDSRIIEALADFSGLELKACPGSDLAGQLFDKAIKPEEAINIIGADAQIIEALKARYGLSKINWHEPPMGLKSNPEAIKEAAAFIAANPARFHFICVGSPQQEMVARAVLEYPKATGVGLCLGASLDFLAGRTERAPLWMQQSRLEWLHRLLSEPKRMWKRYLVEGPKIFGIWLGWQANYTRSQKK